MTNSDTCLQIWACPALRAQADRDTASRHGQWLHPRFRGVVARSMIRDMSETKLRPLAAELLKVKLVIAEIARLARTESVISACTRSSSSSSITDEAAGW